MNILLNALWLLFGGFISAFLWALAGVLMCITVVFLPLGVQCFKFARLSLTPFGYDIDYGQVGNGSVLLNILYLIFFGTELAVAFCIIGVLLCLTVLLIPFGLQMFKFAKLALLPFGAHVRQKPF